MAAVQMRFRAACTLGLFAFSLASCHRSEPGAGVRDTLNDTAAPQAASAHADSQCDRLGLVPCQRQTLYVSVPLAGTSIRLIYASDRVPGRKLDAAPASQSTGLGGWTLSVMSSLDQTSGLMTTRGELLRHVVPKRMQVGAGLLAVADPDNERINVFDPRGREVAVYDARTATRSLSFVWDANGLQQVQDRAGVALKIVHKAGELIRLESPRGPWTELRTAGGWLSEIRSAGGGRTILTMSSAGLLMQILDSNGAARKFEYDDAGRLVASVDAMGERTTWTRSESRTGVTVTTRDPGGEQVVDCVQVGPDGAVQFARTARGGTTKVSQAAMHSSALLPDGRALEVTLEPDAQWGMDSPVLKSMSIMQRGASLPVLSLSEMRSGERDIDKARAWSDVVTINGKSWRQEYDPASLSLANIDPAGRRSTIRFDTLGRIVARSKPRGPAVSYQFDPAGRLQTLTFGAGSDARAWKYHYGNAGDLTITDPLGQKMGVRLRAMGAMRALSGPGIPPTIIETDRLSQLTQFKAAGQGAYRIARRRDGRISAIVPPSGDRPPEYLAYDYDASGNLTRVSSPDTEAVIERDAAGRATAVDYGSGRWSLRFDEAERLTQASGPGAAVTETYEGASRVAEHIQGPFDIEARRAFDAYGYLTSETVGSTPTVEYQHDGGGLLTRAGNLQITRDQQSGRVRSERLGSLTRSWTYDSFGVPVRQTVTADTRELLDIRWQRDGLGRIVEQSVALKGAPTQIERYGYDPSGRLTSWTMGNQTTQYGYDPAGNLTSLRAPGVSETTAEYDSRNELISFSRDKFSYNGAGQLSGLQSSDGSVTAYQYDLSGALLSVARPGSPRITYAVDVFGRRAASMLDGKLQYGIVYADALHPSAELDGNGAVAARYVYAGGQSPAYVTKNRIDYLEVLDGSGSPILVLDSATGAIADAVVRDPYGRVLSETAPKFQLVGFAGGLTDPGIGLVRFGARDYNPRTLRWTAPDPLSLAGGSPNLYSYVAGDPINRIDPSGRIIVSVGGSGTLVGPFGPTVGGGVVLNGGGGFYGTAGLAAGAEEGGSLDLTFSRGETAADKAGLSPGVNFGLGAVGIGLGFSKNAAGGYDLTSFSIGPAAKMGVAVTGTATGVLPVVGYKIPPNDGCGGFGAGNCGFPDANDPDIGTPDDLNSPTQTCSAGGTCNDPGGDCGDGGPCNDTSSMGDPHLRSLDDVFYDLMAVGEFLGLESDTGDLTVQFRQAPVGKSRTISVITAVAINTMGDRIIANANGAGALDVNIDGTPVDVDTGSRVLPHGAQVVREPTTLTIGLADGSELMIRTNPNGLDFVASLVSSRKKHMHGLLGPGAMSTAASPSVRARDGHEFSREQLRDYNILYRQLADSWRLTQKESLFAYKPGETTATFTDKSFPDRVAPRVSDAQRSVAARLCGALGLSPEWSDACAFDIANTGDAGYAASFAAASNVIPRASNAIPRASERISPEPMRKAALTPGATVSGYADGDTPVIYPIETTAGTTAYFAAAKDCQNVPGLAWTVESVDGSVAFEDAAICGDIGRVVFPKTGSYQVRIGAASSTSKGNYQISWLSSRADKHLSLHADADAIGRIDMPGAADFYDFEVAAGTIAYFAAAKDCTSAPGLRWGVENDASVILVGAAICNDVGRVVFTKGGSYRLHVYAPDATTSDYRVSWLSSRPDKHVALGAGVDAAGRIDLPGAADFYDFEAAAGAIAYFAAAKDCTSAPALRWMLESADDSMPLSGAAICNDIGRVVFPKTGRYRIHVYGADGSMSDYRVSRLSSRADKHLSLSAGSDAAGRIDLPGAADYYDFEAAAGAIAYFAAAKDCTSAPALRWTLESADDSMPLSGAAICNNIGRVVFPKTGRYRIHVYAADASTSDYRIGWK